MSCDREGYNTLPASSPLPRGGNILVASNLLHRLVSGQDNILRISCAGERRSVGQGTRLVRAIPVGPSASGLVKGDLPINLDIVSICPSVSHALTFAEGSVGLVPAASSASAGLETRRVRVSHWDYHQYFYRILFEMLYGSVHQAYAYPSPQEPASSTGGDSLAGPRGPMLHRPPALRSRPWFELRGAE